MRIQLAPRLIKFLKKQNVKIRNSFLNSIKLFAKNHYDPQLNNHDLKREWIGHRSIDITTDWRAIYEEVDEGDEIIAYFVALGMHNQLYRSN